MFFPSIQEALSISLAQPCTTATIERTFSTLRRVKTWLRSTMIESRLNGLCLMSVHRKLLIENEEKFIEEVLNLFAADKRRLIF
ncbi:zinc finger MYM-type protein 1-like [Haematobia irritans]|uniref:zinc finger MYM-type protein 1-like n=1 Tax=Haematobia irritans TaxID=7368 RepID=UPI003F50A972